jgi:GT2 family glycosyltransferase
MKLSYVIVTYNRRENLLRTLALLQTNTHLPTIEWETIVVDNASTDGTADAVAHRFPSARILRRETNEGMGARNHSFPFVRAPYVTFLDDDSYPIGDAIPDSLAYLDAHPRTAALVARVILPTGAFEAPAMPGITLGGASTVRTRVLRELGGFPMEFFRQAEEYDLSFRIWQAGYRIERFEDILFMHEKVPSGRSSELTCKLDLRNNLLLVDRYLPRELRREYRRDWLRRYAALATAAGNADVISAAVREARAMRGARQTLASNALESSFDLQYQARAVAEWARYHDVRRVAVCDFSKNVYATYRACREANLEVVGIADDNAAFEGIRYRGATRIGSLQEAVARGVDGLVLSNINPARVDERARELRRNFSGPILRLWDGAVLSRRSGRMARAA